MIFRIVFILCFLICHECSSFVLDWFGWKSEEKFPSTDVPLLQIPFEELGPEDKFLVEANKITGLKLSQLDTCQHKLIMKIKASCGTLSDEELSKLAVNLLNCQADVEGRKTFPCNEDMSLRDCTSGMEADEWNSYHIMSNRARAVCYAARQEQFRALAEMTVNKLVATARAHLEQMTSLNANQEKLEKATEVALDRISRSQRDVLSTYSRLRSLESAFASALLKDENGLKELGILIDSERNEINKVLTDFKSMLEESRKELKSQRQIKTNEHEKVLSTLAQMQHMTEVINKQLGDAQLKSNENAVKLASQFNVTFEMLSSMNVSLNEIYKRVHLLESFANEKTSLIFSYLGTNGENFDIAVLIICHLSCFSLAMIISSFLELPRHLKCVIVPTGVVNIFLALSGNEYAIQLHILYLTLALITAVDLAVLGVYNICQRKNPSATAKIRMSANESCTPQRMQNGLGKGVSNVDEWLTGDLSDNFKWKNGTLPQTPLIRDNDNDSIASSILSRKRGISPSRSVAGSSSSGRKTTCSAIRTNGLRCKLPPSPGQSTCRLHEKAR